MKEGLGVKKVSGVRGFITAQHYTRGMHNGPTIYALERDGHVVGAVAFASPISENVRASVFGVEHKHRVTELHRLVVEDGQPRNSASFLVAHALRLLKSERRALWGVISFADTTEGHVGYVYQACNALYCGVRSGRDSYRDQDGRLRSARQNGVNITRQAAAARGWVVERRGDKHCYLFVVASRRERPTALAALKLSTFPYPKGGTNAAS